MEKEHDFKSVGPENGKLFLQGKCVLCQIPLFGNDPKKRDFCGDCQQIVRFAREDTQDKSL